MVAQGSSCWVVRRRRPYASCYKNFQLKTRPVWSHSRGAPGLVPPPMFNLLVICEDAIEETFSFKSLR